MNETEYMTKPCAKCHKKMALALDNYSTKRGVNITTYLCMNCHHSGKRSSHIRKNEKIYLEE